MVDNAAASSAAAEEAARRAAEAAAAEAARRAAEQARQAEEANRAAQAQAQQAQAQTQQLQAQRPVEDVPGSVDPTSRAGQQATNSREAYLSRQVYDAEPHQRLTMDRRLAEQQAGGNPPASSEPTTLENTALKSGAAAFLDEGLQRSVLPDRHNQTLGDAARTRMESWNTDRVMSTRDAALSARAEADVAQQNLDRARATNDRLRYDPQASLDEVDRAVQDRLDRAGESGVADGRANRAELRASNTAHSAANQEISAANEFGNLPRAALRGGAADAVVSAGFEIVEQKDALLGDDPTKRNQAIGNVAGEAAVGVGTAMAGAAAGAAIGSVIPGAGTAVGFAVGFGLSYAADKMELGDKLGNGFGNAINGAGDFFNRALEVERGADKAVKETVGNAFAGASEHIERAGLGKPFRLDSIFG